mgnify:CR=1 FL=1
MENYNKATMDVQERSNPLFEKLTDLPSLTIEKKSSESLNEIEIENTWQKDDLLFIANAMEKLNKVTLVSYLTNYNFPLIKHRRFIYLAISLDGILGAIVCSFQKPYPGRITDSDIGPIHTK